MENTNYRRWAELLKTIGHPIRIRIIESLLDNDKCVSNIWSALDLPQATVSQHLSLLRTKGIVENKRCGAKVRYSITDRSIEEIINLIKKCELT
jgi:DNA-binding transcriptional ArsR family regulator